MPWSRWMLDGHTNYVIPEIRAILRYEHPNCRDLSDLSLEPMA